MKGPLRFVIIPAASGYKLLCQYKNDEITWGPFKTLMEVSQRIQVALENLDKQKL
jgi:hypothetical protein